MSIDEFRVLSAMQSLAGGAGVQALPLIGMLSINLVSMSVLCHCDRDSRMVGVHMINGELHAREKASDNGSILRNALPARSPFISERNRDSPPFFILFFFSTRLCRCNDLSRSYGSINGLFEFTVLSRARVFFYLERL